MDFKKMTDKDILQYCKNHQIKYLNTKGNIYTRKTLIKYIMSSIDKKNNIQQNHIPQNDIQPQYINKVVWTLEEKQDPNENYKKIKDNLCSIIKKCHQLLYSSNAIVGIKAQNDIMKILTLKILQPQFIDESSELMKKCKELLDNGYLSKNLYDKYLTYSININELSNSNDTLNNWDFYVKRFLSKILPVIYDEDDTKFNMNDKNTLIKLFDILSKINVDDEFIDAFSTSYGDIHEAFRVYGGGKGAKELGQFFTPRHLIHSIINGCGFNNIIQSYHNPTIYDPCMGTGGLLTRTYSNGNILPSNIYGCETEKDTIKFAECSILLTTKEFNSNIIRCDSICNNSYIFENKFDIIFTNPPFGTKMKYKELKTKFNNFKELNYENSNINFEDIYNYETNNGACLFIQHCMYMLKDNGVCAIVLPDGELFTGKTFTKFRKFMCDNINIIKIIRVEGGVFEYTSIKTSIIIFQKNGSTQNIEFMDINKECNEVKSNTILNINIIINKNYSFNLNDYIQKQNKINTDFEMKKLGNVCEFQNGKGINKSSFIHGEYPVIGGGQKPIGYHNQYNTKENVILCSSSGAYSGFISKYNKKVWKSDCFSIIPNKELLNNNYLYYYLKNIQDNIYKLQKGNAQPHVYSSDLKHLEIPIPSLEIQEIIVNKLNKINYNIETIKTRINQLKDEGNLFLETYNINTELKKLGDICDINIGGTPSRNKNEYYENGNNLWVSVKELNGGYIYDTKEKITDLGVKNSNVKLFTKDTILFSFKLSIGKTAIVGNSLYTNEAIAGIVSKNSNILNKYLYYYLSINDFSKYGSGVFGNGSLNKKSLEELEIPIPSLEVQEKLIKILDNIYNKIEEENKHIELLEQLSKDIIKID
jgi:type I restriction enzyme S subunit